MKLGIVICPRCKQAKGIHLSYKTTKCFRCRKVLTIKNLKIFFKTDSQEKLRQAIGTINFELNRKKKI
jgi:hypothetical protein